MFSEFSRHVVVRALVCFDDFCAVLHSLNDIFAIVFDVPKFRNPCRLVAAKKSFHLTLQSNGATEAAPPYLRYVQVSDQAVSLFVGYLEAGFADEHFLLSVACFGKIHGLDRTKSCD